MRQFGKYEEPDMPKNEKKIKKRRQHNRYGKGLATEGQTMGTKRGKKRKARHARVVWVGTAKCDCEVKTDNELRPSQAVTSKKKIRKKRGRRPVTVDINFRA